MSSRRSRHHLLAALPKRGLRSHIGRRAAASVGRFGLARRLPVASPSAEAGASESRSRWFSQRLDLDVRGSAPLAPARPLSRVAVPTRRKAESARPKSYDVSRHERRLVRPIRSPATGYENVTRRDRPVTLLRTGPGFRNVSLDAQTRGSFDTRLFLRVELPAMDLLAYTMARSMRSSGARCGITDVGG